MGTVRDLAERLWTGAETTEKRHPLMTFLGLEELAEGMAFVSSLANVSAFDTADGLVLIDTGSFVTAGSIYANVRGWNDKSLHTAVYTHGHVDHVFGVARFDDDARDRGRDRPVVIAHEALPARFDRYKLTAGYNGAINARQFRTPGLTWPTDYRYPDTTYRDHFELEVGGVRFELHHDRGETDDHTWVWVPAHRTVCTGDLFIWASPNCGNPQKVQRYPKEWAHALDKMRALDAEVLLPGHGPPIIGADRVALALGETAELLHLVHDRTVDLMNQGKTLDAVMHEIDVPRHLLERPYLRAVYDEPAFIVRNIWRLYGGWYDGNPARLKPAADGAIAAEVVALAGGVEALIARATALADAGDPAACQLAEWAWQAQPDSAAVRELRASVYERRAAAETSLMARSIYSAAAEEARRKP